MKILIINVVCGIGSTGCICANLAEKLEKQGHTVKIAYGRAEVPEQYKRFAVRIGNDLDVIFHAIKARLFDSAGFGSRWYTEQFIKWVKKFDPDEIHLHNIHGYYINVQILFNYLRTCGKRIIWTLHDCWAFTGHCTHFAYIGCEKWKKGCERCPQKNVYPSSILLDQSIKNYKRKKELFIGIKGLKISVPSQWLGNIVRESYLQNYPIELLPNKIDIDIFRPMISNFRLKHGIASNDIMILGVSSVWNKKKGLDDFIELSRMLPKRYKIVLVGLASRQIARLDSNILGIGQIKDMNELAKIYSSADVFVNPSKEESFGLTTLEAISCGVPVIVYKNTACEEVAKNSNSGVAVEQDVREIYKAITNMFPSTFYN